MKKKLIINLDSPAGNANNLLAIASQVCKKTNRDFVPIKKEMTSAGYDNLVNVFERYFGRLFQLTRN